MNGYVIICLSSFLFDLFILDAQRNPSTCLCSSPTAKEGGRAGQTIFENILLYHSAHVVCSGIRLSNVCRHVHIHQNFPKDMNQRKIVGFA